MNNEVNTLNIVFLILLAAWSMFWKGLALWRAAKGNQNRWFIAFIILFPFNSLGIFEAIYLFRFAKHRLTIEEIKNWFSKAQK